MVNPLDRKLLRDLTRMRGQAAAIAAVIALGVLMTVMMNGLVTTLEETRRAYYDRYRLADIFVPVTRAPEHALARLDGINGVAAVTGRIRGAALIDVGARELPVRAQALSLPDRGAPRLNDIYLARGRMPAIGRRDEIVLLEGFALARGLSPGDTLRATMNGVRRQLQVVGLAQAPEFLYTTAPGEIVPDDARFAVFWMRRSTMAAVFDMRGAFNEALMSLARGGREEAVIAAADRILASYGAAGAYGLADQASNRFVTEEIRGLRGSAVSVPPVFLAVAAFLLYIVISRMVQSEREQIGLLKAFGYSSTEVAAHYLKLVLLIAVIGAAAGALAGVASGRSLAVFYQGYFKFPFLVFTVHPGSFVTGFLVSVATASAGGLFVLRRIFALTPAVAMRPPAPSDYSHAPDLAALLRRWLDQPSRMVLRRIGRHPGRMGGAVLGIGAGMALSMSVLSLMAGFDTTIDLSYSVIDRSDVTVSFGAPVSDRAAHELARIPGVLHVEPVRVVPAILRKGRYSYRGALEGRHRGAFLNRVVDAGAEPLEMRRDGVVLGRALADILHLQAGDLLRVEVREGRRPVLVLPVVAIAETLMGAPAFLEIGQLNRALLEPGRISAAFLRIDPAREAALFARLKALPGIAGATRKRDTMAALVRLMNTGPGAVRYVMLAVAAVITFGIVYNAARIGLAERSRDLASLRVMGFTRAEAGFVLLGELAVVTLVALPVGLGLGYGLTFLIAAGFSTDIYQIPVVFSPSSLAVAVLAVIASASLSGWLVERDMARTDLVSALKARE